MNKDYSEIAKNQQIQEHYPEIIDVVNNPLLSSSEKKSELSSFIPRMDSDIKKKQKEINGTLLQLDIAEKKIYAKEDVDKWLDVIDTDNIRLQRNNCSRLHQLGQAAREEKILVPEKEQGLQVEWDTFWETAHSFVVEHDWAKAFETASDYDGEVQLPYPISAFEFMVEGKCIINIAVTADQQEREEKDLFFEGVNFVLLPFVKEDDIWVCCGDEVVKNKGFIMMFDEIKAVCIALEAEIAVENIIRAPYKLNKKREEKSKLPLFDYHVVSLNRKFRVAADSQGGTHASPRFHFRRGHWRHYENHKSYIKWTLVGSPELGFIDKHYKL